MFVFIEIPSNSTHIVQKFWTTAILQALDGMTGRIAEELNTMKKEEFQTT